MNKNKNEVLELLKIIKEKDSTTVEVYKWVFKPVLKEKVSEFKINSTNDKDIENEIENRLTNCNLF